MSNASDIRLIQLNNYIRPKILEQKSKDWVLNGKNNCFYQDIINRFNGSPTNAAIINSYIDLIIGRGLVAERTDRRIVEFLEFKTLLSSDDLRRIVADFELFGEASLQVIKTRGGGLSSINHIPKQYVVPQIENEDGEIEGYWYCKNFARQSQNPPQYFPAFGTSKESIEIYNIKPYKAGNDYFSDPDYIAGIPYALAEEEIANYYVSHIQNGLSFGYIINIPNGNSLSNEEKDLLERQIKQKLTGSSNAGKFVLSFNGVDADITVTAIDGNDAHKQWEFLVGEARQQLLTAHRVTSPMLFGIKDNTGLGNNADELDTAEAQLMKRVIYPKQKYITDALETILIQYGINLQLKFLPLTEVTEKPLEAIQTEMSSDSCGCKKKSELETILLKYALDTPEGYELYDGEDLELSAIQNSEQDSKEYKIRYAYTIGTSKSPKGGSREFCNVMMNLASQGKVYRKEDIEIMSSQGVNGQFAHSGGKYDIFLYGGGVNCYHRWERRIFKKKRQEDGDLYGGNAMQNTNEINVNQARREGAKIPKNSKDVAIAEIDKPNKGKYPS